jgi:hypothetical protein
MNKIILYGIILVIICSFINAVPPFQTTSDGSTNTLNIVYPQIDILLQNSVSTFNFHVYNSSGFLLRNDTIDCYFHFYNNTGNHLLNQQLLFDTDDNDFYIILNQSITSKTGKYNYLIHCNNTEAGFVSISIEIKKNDNDDTFEMLSSILSVFITIIIIIGILIFLYLAVDKSHVPLKALIYFGVLVMGLAPITFLENFISTLSDANGLSGVGNTLLSIYFIFVFIILMYFGVWITRWYFDKLKTKKETDGDI